MNGTVLDLVKIRPLVSSGVMFSTISPNKSSSPSVCQVFSSSNLPLPVLLFPTVFFGGIAPQCCVVTCESNPQHFGRLSPTHIVDTNWQEDNFHRPVANSTSPACSIFLEDFIPEVYSIELSGPRQPINQKKHKPVRKSVNIISFALVVCRILVGTSVRVTAPEQESKLDQSTSFHQESSDQRNSFRDMFPIRTTTRRIFQSEAASQLLSDHGKPTSECLLESHVLHKNPFRQFLGNLQFPSRILRRGIRLFSQKILDCSQDISEWFSPVA
jgi:hypothetical protein